MMMIKGDSHTFTLEGRCPFCGKVFHVTVPTDGYIKWRYEGHLIQDALPNVDAATRELLISNICLDCQKGLFREEEEEDWDDEPAFDLDMGFDPYEGDYTWDC